jgi:hypothetical protein
MKKLDSAQAEYNFATYIDSKDFLTDLGNCLSLDHNRCAVEILENEKQANWHN